MNTDELDFSLPVDLIAQTPSPDRAGSRLLHYRRAEGSVAHRIFSDLVGVLRPDDVLVFNDAKVIPARFVLKKNTGGRIEGLFLGALSPRRWLVMLKNLGTSRAPLSFLLDPTISVQVAASHAGGEYEVEVATDETAFALLDRIGQMPLPPYIRRQKQDDPADADDRVRYQTVYARNSGSVAAPTAGLHFTDAILQELDARGISRVCVTLHVGAGTFKPVSVPTLDQHIMHSESYSISVEAAEKLNRAQEERRRIVAVGTTSARVLESWPVDQPWRECNGQTSIFIRPPYAWTRVSALITNFHLPRSTLVALVAAFTGLEAQRRLYALAIEHRYRFFSYGDSMFLE